MDASHRPRLRGMPRIITRTQGQPRFLRAFSVFVFLVPVNTPSHPKALGWGVSRGFEIFLWRGWGHTNTHRRRRACGNPPGSNVVVRRLFFRLVVRPLRHARRPGPLRAEPRHCPHASPLARRRCLRWGSRFAGALASTPLWLSRPAPLSGSSGATGHRRRCRRCRRCRPGVVGATGAGKALAPLSPSSGLPSSAAPLVPACAVCAGAGAGAPSSRARVYIGSPVGAARLARALVAGRFGGG